MIDVAMVLSHTTIPSIVFAAPPEADVAADVLDLRAHDLPRSGVSLRNDVRQRWRAHKRLVVRVDDDPSAQVLALLMELARREVRLDAAHVDRFDETHTLVVKIAAPAPPAALVRFFPIRVRAPSQNAATTRSTPRSTRATKNVAANSNTAANPKGGQRAGRR